MDILTKMYLFVPVTVLEGEPLTAYAGDFKWDAVDRAMHQGTNLSILLHE